MTMVVIACHADRAVVMTDTASYSKSVSHMTHTSKTHFIPHLSCALVTQGDSAFGLLADLGIEQAAFFSESYDDLVLKAPQMLRDHWEYARSLEHPDTPPPEVTTAFLVGFSPSQGRFTMRAFGSDQDFESLDVGDLWVSPTPWNMRPSQREVDSLRREIGEDLPVFAEWLGKPAPEMPTSPRDFIDLALTIRFLRALQPFCRVVVAGRAFMSTLRPDGFIENVKLLDFDDDGAEFLELVSQTAHPLAQVEPCECGSGTPGIQCCWIDETCICGTRKPFRDCCMVGAEQIPALVAERERYLAHGASS